MIIKNPQFRKYIYGILVAAGAVALCYGIVTKEQLFVWVALGGAILGNGLAGFNVADGDGEHRAE